MARTGPIGPLWGYITVEAQPRRWWQPRRWRVSVECREGVDAVDGILGREVAEQLARDAEKELRDGHMPPLAALYYERTW